MDWPNGQQRRAWLDRQFSALDDGLQYYLGPTGIPDRLSGLANLAAFTDAGDYVEAGEASQALWNDPSLQNAARYATAGTALSLPIVSARGLNLLGDAAASGLDDLTRFVGSESGALYGGDSVDEVLQFVREGRPFYHSGTADVAEDIHRWGVEPQTGPWVREILEGAADESMIDDVLDAPSAAWWADAPEWVEAKVRRITGKSEVTPEDIRQYGHLAIADADEWGGSVYRVGEDGLSDGEYSRLTTLDGDTVRLYETPLYDHDTRGRYPFGIERNELITGETIEPRFSLTGDELVDFLARYRGLDRLPR